MQGIAINIDHATSCPSTSGEGLGRGEQRCSHSENLTPSPSPEWRWVSTSMTFYHFFEDIFISPGLLKNVLKNSSSIQGKAINIDHATSCPSTSGEGLGRGEQRCSHSNNYRSRLRLGRGERRCSHSNNDRLRLRLGRGEQKFSHSNNDRSRFRLSWGEQRRSHSNNDRLRLRSG